MIKSNFISDMDKNKKQQNSNNLNNYLMKSIAITPPIYKLVLIAIVVICIIASVWGLFGSIPQRVQGIGMINTVSGVDAITPLVSGRITELKVELDDTLKEGDIIAVLEQPELKSSIDQLKYSIESLKQTNKISSKSISVSSKIKKESYNLEIERLNYSLNEVNENIEFFNKKLKEEKEIYEKGLITYSQYFATKQQLESYEINKIEIQEQIKLSELKMREANIGNELNNLSKIEQIGLLELQLENLTSTYEKASLITAVRTGYISALNVQEGDLVSPDVIIALITDTYNQELSYVLNLYVPFNSNATISEGMDVDIQIFSVDPYLHGYLNGKVKRVGQYMANSQGLFNTLGNQDLVESLEAKGGVYSVEVELVVDPNTYTGYSWSNGEGPQTKVHPGQLCLAYVDVKVKAPLDLILPIFKAYFE